MEVSRMSANNNNPAIHKDKPLYGIVTTIFSVLFAFYTGTDIDQDMVGRVLDATKQFSNSPLFLVAFGVVGLYLNKRGWVSPDRRDESVASIDAGIEDISEIVREEVRKQLGGGAINTETKEPGG